MTPTSTHEEPDPYDLFIGGAWREASSGRRFPAIDPFRGEPWATLADAGQSDVDDAVAAAYRAFETPDWREMAGGTRAALMRRLADIIERDAEALAHIETRDNGKLLREMRAQCRSLPAWLRYFSGIADKIQGDVIPVDKPDFLVYTRREPIGVVGAIVPWNSPLLLLMWKLAPALAAGCTLVVKPAEQTSVSTLEFAKCFQEAGFPDGVLNVVTGEGPETGRALATHPNVAKVAFTGSPATAIEIVRGSAPNLTPLVLELGGKSANIVFDDADLDAAANGVIAGIFAATGQTCVAGSRLLVHENVYDELIERVVARARTIRLGDPVAADTEMGPVAFERQLAVIERYVQLALDDGASIACGGKRSPELGGLFYEPTVLTGVDVCSRVAQEEIFGPVLCAIPFATEAEAVQIANATRYALAAGVWTRDIGRGHRVSHRLDAGTVWVNAYRVISHEVPFGGSGMSGWGRENGVEAIREYTKTKSIWVELSGRTRDPFVLG